MNVRTFFRGALVAVVSATILPFATAGTVVYDFAGTCTFGCTGTMSAILTLQNYNPGDALTENEVVSLVYASSDLSATISSLEPGQSFTSSMPVTTGGSVFVVQGTYPGYIFGTGTAGGWSISFLHDTKDSAGPKDVGSGGTWTLQSSGVPEPSAFLLGLAGIAVAGVACGLGRKG